MLETKDISPDLEEITNNIQDPFAVDFFGSSVSVGEIEQEIVEIKEETEIVLIKPAIEKIKPKRWERNLKRFPKAI